MKNSDCDRITGPHWKVFARDSRTWVVRCEMARIHGSGGITGRGETENSQRCGSGQQPRNYRRKRNPKQNHERFYVTWVRILFGRSTGRLLARLAIAAPEWPSASAP